MEIVRYLKSFDHYCEANRFEKFSSRAAVRSWGDAPGARPSSGTSVIGGYPAATDAVVKKSVGMRCSSFHVMAMGRSPAC